MQVIEQKPIPLYLTAGGTEEAIRILKIKLEKLENLGSLIHGNYGSLQKMADNSSGDTKVAAEPALGTRFSNIQMELENLGGRLELALNQLESSLRPPIPLSGGSGGGNINGNIKATY